MDGSPKVSGTLCSSSIVAVKEFKLLKKPQTATSHISHWLAKIFALVVLRGVEKLLSANKYLAQRVACFRDNEL